MAIGAETLFQCPNFPRHLDQQSGSGVEDRFVYFFGGDATRPVADPLVEDLSDFRVILAHDERWRKKVMESANTGTSIVERHAFSHDYVDRSHLQTLAASVPDSFEVREMDLELARRIVSEVHEHLIPDFCWRSPDDFVKGGFGYCAISRGRIEAGVTSALLTSKAAAIQINTNPDQRNRGVATTLAATFLLTCIDRGILPHWDTGDSVSYHLAEKLGNRLIGSYEVLEWEPVR